VFSLEGNRRVAGGQAQRNAASLGRNFCVAVVLLILDLGEKERAEIRTIALSRSESVVATNRESRPLSMRQRCEP
jgi:hypothetical protein